jgi:hypothetical protein
VRSRCLKSSRQTQSTRTFYNPVGFDPAEVLAVDLHRYADYARFFLHTLYSQRVFKEVKGVHSRHPSTEPPPFVRAYIRPTGLPKKCLKSPRRKMGVSSRRPLGRKTVRVPNVAVLAINRLSAIGYVLQHVSY